ncbi:MAG: Crp/Fnr family transcriptional regulator [Novosphingobium sp.]|nr:Crp/Fnr family transcriptional regulator [Novosphingobium sp.]MCP5403387.1 Crp/Fnr family transcriptional regulator [Novosphingobium sp.]
MANATSHVQALKRLLPEPLGQQLESHARLVSLRANQIVIGHQDRTTDVFVVLEGNLRVELYSLNGREIILADLGPGELFGEFAALDELPRSASVTTTSKCVLANIPGEVFRQKALADPVTAEWLAKRLIGQIRLLTERIFELNALAVRNRLHCELLRLSLDAGVVENQALVSPAPTHADLANRIGSHREAVTRELQYLQKEGIVEQHGRQLGINDVKELAEIVRAAAGDVDLIQRAFGRAPE